MKILTLSFVAGLALFCSASQAATFNYHGVLQDAGKPAEGKYDIELTLYASPNGGSVIGGPLTMYGVDVHDGSFATEVDFGPMTKSSQNAYVGVKVRSAGFGDFTSLGNSPAIVDTNSSCPGSWSLDGNAGIPTGSYLGTADASDVVVKAGGNEVGRFAAATGAFSAATNFAAHGNQSTALSDGYVVSGSYAFSAGFNSAATFDGSFVWGDTNPNVGIQDTAANQFIAQASGGVAINSAPKSASTELSIYPSATSGDNHSHLFFGNTGKVGGILASAGDETTATSNDAAFYLDQFDGTNQVRRFVVSPLGRVGINATASDGGVNPLNAELVLGSSSAPYLATLKLQGTSTTTTSILLSGNAALSGSSPVSPSFDVYGTLGNGSTARYAEFGPTQTFFNGAGGGTQALTVGYNGTNGGAAYLTKGGVWTNASSRAFKDGFAVIDPIGVLKKLIAMPVQTWTYKEDHAEGRHMGPVAEDFAQAFGLGDDETHIGSVDESGVAFAAIQGLNQKLESDNAELRKQLDVLAARLSALEKPSGE